eukprot:1174804-Amorphochlora_amoeboformis.AAC.1
MGHEFRAKERESPVDSRDLAGANAFLPRKCGKEASRRNFPLVFSHHFAIAGRDEAPQVAQIPMKSRHSLEYPQGITPSRAPASRMMSPCVTTSEPSQPHVSKSKGRKGRRRRTHQGGGRAIVDGDRGGVPAEGTFREAWQG